MIKDKKSIKILDVGGGDGKRLKLLIDLLNKKEIAVSATLVEPSRSFTDNLKKSLIKNNYNIRVVKGKFENFNKIAKFDLVLFIHSTYTFEDSVYFKKAKNLLEKNGLMVIITNDKNSFLAKLKKITDLLHRSQRREVSHVLTDLKKEGIAYELKKFNTVFFGITENNKLTKNGRSFFTWVALRPYNKINRETIKIAEKLFLANSRNGKMIERENLILVNPK